MAVAHIECRKDAEVIDESLAIYKLIDAVTVVPADRVKGGTCAVRAMKN